MNFGHNSSISFSTSAILYMQFIWFNPCFILAPLLGTIFFIIFVHSQTSLVFDMLLKIIKLTIIELKKSYWELPQQLIIWFSDTCSAYKSKSNEVYKLRII